MLLPQRLVVISVICECDDESRLSLFWSKRSQNLRYENLEIAELVNSSPAQYNHKTTYSSYDTFQEGMYHPKGEMDVSVMIVYVHKACEIKQSKRSTNERYPWYI